MAKGQSLRCLGIVVRKNFMLKRRTIVDSLVELLVPVALMALLIWVRVKLVKEQHPAMSYVDSRLNNPTYYPDEQINYEGLFNGSIKNTLDSLCKGEISNICPEILTGMWRARQAFYLGWGLDGFMLMHMAEKNQRIGIIGNKDFADFVEAIPGFKVEAKDGSSFSFVKLFESSAQMSDYIQSKRYGLFDDHPALFTVVEVLSVAQKGEEGTFVGTWAVNIHLNATSPSNPQGAAGVPNDPMTRTFPLLRKVDFTATRVYWSGGFDFDLNSLSQLGSSPELGLDTPPTGGFVDLQALFYAWVYNSTGAYTLPTPLPCKCLDDENQLTEDFRQCSNTFLTLMQVMTPAWTTVESTLQSMLGTSAANGQHGQLHGCLGRVSGLLPISMRELPFPTAAYTQDTFAEVTEATFGLFFTILFLWPLTRIIKSFVDDKEARINEVMKMMGISGHIITVGWYLTYGILWAIPSALIALTNSTTVFQYSNDFLIFLFFWLFCNLTVTFCGLLSIFFDQSRTASIIGCLLFLMLFFPWTSVSSKDMSVQLLSSVSPPLVLAIGARIIINLEAAEFGLQWDTLGVMYQEMNIFTVFVMMVFDILLFATLTWYLDKVIVVGFGTAQPWYFCLTSRFWFAAKAGKDRQFKAEESDGEPEIDDGHGEAGSAEESSGSSEIEQTSDEDDTPLVRVNSQGAGLTRFELVPASANLRRTVVVRKLKKLFTTQDGRLLQAVAGLSVDLYQGQIFVLLGHNGAGKTTTINMLSGMLPIDGGEAIMYGMSVKNDMDSVREILGVCPQHDVIWSTLTVYEHLAFFARAKGIPEQFVDTEIDIMILDTGLQEKRHSMAGTLSGGQKRRLSAGIALIGGSKVVFLDEPSSGVDPYSRRQLWDCLQEKKRDRTLIMTTHFMDEAEVLGDRIAIMAAGQIKCVGSALFLKAQYGVGYTLTICRRASSAGPNQALSQVIMGACPSAVVLSDASTELVLRMPMEESHAFPVLFEKFERHPAELGIEFFSVSVTTLEEVFLQVGRDAGMEEEDKDIVRQLSRRKIDQTAGAPPSTGIASAGAPPSSHAMMQAPPVHMTGASFCGNIRTLLIKRVQSRRRDRKAWACEVCVPAVFILTALISLRTSSIGTWPATPMTMEYSFGDFQQTVVVGHGPNVEPQNLKPLLEGFGDSDLISLHDLKNESSRDAQEFSDYLLSTYYRGDEPVRAGACRFQMVPQWDQELSINRFPWTVENYRIPGKVNSMFPASPTAQLWPNGFTVPVGTSWGEVARMNFSATAGAAAPPGSNLEIPIGELNNRLQVDLFWNSTARDAVPIFFHELNQRLLRTTVGAETLNNAKMEVFTQAFPWSSADMATRNAMAALFVALGFSFIPASYAAFAVMERETGSKHLQVISGVNFVSYWLSSLFWDALNYVIPAALCLALLYLFDMEALVGPDILPWTCLVVWLFGLSSASFSYMLSFLFDSHSNCQNMLIMFYMMTGGILKIVQSLMHTVDPSWDFLCHGYRIIPTFCLADALFNAFIMKSFGAIAFECAVPTDCKPWEMSIFGLDMIYMAAVAVACFCITLLLELATATPAVRALFTLRASDSNLPAAIRPLDGDVQIEKDRVLSGAADDEMIVFKGLRKVFPKRGDCPPKVAVADLYLGIPQGECFGYLGMNGAGKTTTMKILTGEQLATAGGATLGGFDIQTEQQQVRQLLGYCPQFDALIGKLTAREHLQLFARIKGVPEDELDPYVEAMLDQLTLTPYADRQTATFSGGTKRKLSVGIALIGNPKVVFLDEPTTGVDPESRRFMWTVISSTMQGRSVILTTHSMDECEALCSRIGIMVNGQFVCLGSSVHLKAMHGAGYQFDVTFGVGPNLSEKYHKLLDHMRHLFRGPDSVEIVEGSPGSTRVMLQLRKGQWQISAIFRNIEQHREALDIAEYSVSETTLDQIFINFARQQEDEQTGRIGKSVSIGNAESLHLTSAV